MRDQKKFHEQQNTEQEAIVGSKPSPARPAPTKKAAPAAGGQRLSVGNGTPSSRGGGNGSASMHLSLNQNGIRSMSRGGMRDPMPSAPVNYASMSKENSTTLVSPSDPQPTSS